MIGIEYSRSYLLHFVCSFASVVKIIKDLRKKDIKLRKKEYFLFQRETMETTERSALKCCSGYNQWLAVLDTVSSLFSH